jgi:hypothetical protein
MDMLKDSMSGDASEIGEILRRHPLPLALIGLGVGWMVISATSGRGGVAYRGQLRERVSGAMQTTADKAGALAGQIREKVAGASGAASSGPPPGPYPTESAGYAYARRKSGEAMRKARASTAQTGDSTRDALHRAKAAGSSAWQRASDYAGQARGQLREAGDRFGELLEDHPLAVGALGLLAGSLLALLRPRSEAEERLAGTAAEEIRERAAHLGREAAERAHHVAERTVDAAMDAVTEAVSDGGNADRHAGESSAAAAGSGQTDASSG